MWQNGQEYPTFVKGVEYFSLADSFRHFRETVEKDTGVPIQTLEVNAAEFLDDVMKWIGLGDNKRDEALGKSAGAYLTSLLNERVKIPTRH